MSDHVPEQGAPSTPKPGVCEECKANRRRMISLAADMVGLRKAVDRLDASDVSDLGERVDRLEWALYAVLGAVVIGIIVDVRHGR